MPTTEIKKITETQLGESELQSISESILLECKSNKKVLKDSLNNVIKDNPHIIGDVIKSNPEIFSELFNSQKPNSEIKKDEFTLTQKRIITLGFGLGAIAIFVTFAEPYNIFGSILFTSMAIISGIKSIRK